MSFVAVLSSDRRLRAVLQQPTGIREVAPSQTWERLTWLVRERPVSGAVLDVASLPGPLPADAAVAELHRRFPSLATVLIARPGADPLTLFRLGRSGLAGLVLLPADSLSDVRGALRDALRGGTEAVVTRAVSAYLPARETLVVRLALAGAQHGWSAEDLAEHVGLTRPHASVRLRAHGLPSVGHLLVWAKLLHAGRWLGDPGRSAESVSRQLGYSSGAAFRRALRTYVGLTPSGVKALGGLRPVLARFLDACGLPDSLQGDRFVA